MILLLFSKNSVASREGLLAMGPLYCFMRGLHIVAIRMR